MPCLTLSVLDLVKARPGCVNVSSVSQTEKGVKSEETGKTHLLGPRVRGLDRGGDEDQGRLVVVRRRLHQGGQGMRELAVV